MLSTADILGYIGIFARIDTGRIVTIYIYGKHKIQQQSNEDGKKCDGNAYKWHTADVNSQSIINKLHKNTEHNLQRKMKNKTM